MAAKDTAGAKQAYHQWIAITPSSAEAHSSLGRCMAEQGAVRTALSSVRRAIEIDPENARYQAQLEGLTIPERTLYRPVFSPWLREHGEFREVYERAISTSLVGRPRCYVLYTLAKQALALPGEIWECGVYKGGTAAMLAELAARNGGNRLRLFDTFAGMPETDPRQDRHKAGDFSDTSLQSVQRTVGHPDITTFHEGYIPDTFVGLEDSRISFAHVDVDIYQSVLDCCRFIYPRLLPGGFMVFDDYGALSCSGAKVAIEEYFSSTGAMPLALQTGQAVVFKSTGPLAKPAL